MELAAEGGMAGGSAGAVVTETTAGPRTGLTAAPCLAPATQHWFAGIGSGGSDPTSLVLTNPDDAQAEVDLRYYGRRGRVTVPGSTAVVVPAHARRTVALGSLDPDAGPYSVDVRVGSGRVSAIALRTRAAKLKPTGVDWQLPSSPAEHHGGHRSGPIGVGAPDADRGQPRGSPGECPGAGSRTAGPVPSDRCGNSRRAAGEQRLGRARPGSRR